MKNKYVYDFYGHKIEFILNRFAGLSAGNCYLKYNDSALLSTINYSNHDSTLNYFPFQVNFVEKLYAVGKIPGNFFRRETKPSEHAVLVSRATDRTFRPLFNQNIRTELQIISTLFATDFSCNNKILNILAISIALNNSSIPFDYAVNAVEIGYVNKKLVVNPSLKDMENSPFSLVISGVNNTINMIEFAGEEINKSLIYDALKLGFAACQKLDQIQKDIIQNLSNKKISFNIEEENPELTTLIKTLNTKHSSFLKKYLSNNLNIDERHKLFAEFYQKNKKSMSEDVLSLAINKILYDHVYNQVIKKQERVDKRKLTELRPLKSEIDVIPIVHGSGLFGRGQTEVLSITTLASLHEDQIIENTSLEENKSFFHQYNFPPFSTGSVRRLMAPNRREVGHGCLVESALKQVLPSATEFPYCIRQVSEVLSSNGSTSQASICAANLSLMAAGVPMKNHLAGISIGLVVDEKNKKNYLLTDIQGMEDFCGKMDFKIASTKKGLCAMQLDTKVLGIDYDTIVASIEQADNCNMQLIDYMSEIISEPRKSVAPTAPKIDRFFINPDLIKTVIGSGGKTINEIIRNNDNVKIDISDNGEVIIYHHQQEIVDKVKNIIQDLVYEPIENDTLKDCKIVNIQEFGIFVEIGHNQDGLIPFSFLNHLNIDINKLKVGQKIDVKVKSIVNGKIKLDLLNAKKLLKEYGITNGHKTLSRNDDRRNKFAYIKKRKSVGSFNKKLKSQTKLDNLKFANNIKSHKGSFK